MTEKMLRERIRILHLGSQGPFPRNLEEWMVLGLLPLSVPRVYFQDRGGPE